MNRSGRNKILLFAAVLFLFCTVIYLNLKNEDVFVQQGRVSVESVTSHDSQSFGDLKTEMPNLGKNIKSCFDYLKKIKKIDGIDFESYQLEGRRVTSDGNDDYLIAPLLDNKVHYCGNWGMDIETIQDLTNKRSASFHFNIRRQHLPGGRIKDRLVLILDNINAKYCSESIRHSNVAVATSTNIIIDDNSYSDGCAQSNDGTVYYFISVA